MALAVARTAEAVTTNKLSRSEVTLWQSLKQSGEEFVVMALAVEKNR
jgi:hypothetical protein